MNGAIKMDGKDTVFKLVAIKMVIINPDKCGICDAKADLNTISSEGNTVVTNKFLFATIEVIVVIITWLNISRGTKPENTKSV